MTISIDIWCIGYFGQYDWRVFLPCDRAIGLYCNSFDSLGEAIAFCGEGTD